MPRSFLLIGIAWDQYPSMLPADKVDGAIAAVREMLARDEKSFKDAGLDYEFIEYSPAEDMSRLVKVLQEKKWHGVCVGIGIRATKQFTPFFEALVNTVHEKSPTSKLLFNSTPDDTLQAAKRQFTDLQ